ncbi:unnamed protein product [Phyllotreta striolata]|uniref:Uncharacterized protein n=1 Tax=Phyllotreta striolata TaxID=444603 RepID=A0A9N9XKF9_PHYSR|nr:unnamed protein product [Phyllotreta striolata]
MSEEKKGNALYIQLPSKSSSENSNRVLQHPYIYAPCSKCSKTHFQQYAVVKGFMLKFVDQLRSLQSKSQLDSEESQLFLKCVELESDCSMSCDTSHQDICSLKTLSTNKCKESDSDFHMPFKRHNGLDPSDLIISRHKSTQCCVKCLDTQELCPKCSGLMDNSNSKEKIDADALVKITGLFQDTEEISTSSQDKACSANPSSRDIACDSITTEPRNQLGPYNQVPYSTHTKTQSGAALQQQKSSNIYDKVANRTNCLVCGMTLF